MAPPLATLGHTSVMPMCRRHPLQPAAFHKPRPFATTAPLVSVIGPRKKGVWWDMPHGHTWSLVERACAYVTSLVVALSFRASVVPTSAAHTVEGLSMFCRCRYQALQQFECTCRRLSQAITVGGVDGGAAGDFVGFVDGNAVGDSVVVVDGDSVGKLWVCIVKQTEAGAKVGDGYEYSVWLRMPLGWDARDDSDAHRNRRRRPRGCLRTGRDPPLSNGSEQRIPAVSKAQQRVVKGFVPVARSGVGEALEKSNGRSVKEKAALLRGDAHCCACHCSDHIAAWGAVVGELVPKVGEFVGDTVINVGAFVGEPVTEIGVTVGNPVANVGADDGDPEAKVGTAVGDPVAQVGATVGDIVPKTGDIVGVTVPRVGVVEGEIVPEVGAVVAACTAGPGLAPFERSDHPAATDSPGQEGRPPSPYTAHNPMLARKMYPAAAVHCSAAAAHSAEVVPFFRRLSSFWPAAFKHQPAIDTPSKQKGITGDAVGGTVTGAGAVVGEAVGAVSGDADGGTTGGAVGAAEGADGDADGADVGVGGAARSLDRPVPDVRPVHVQPITPRGHRDAGAAHGVGVEGVDALEVGAVVGDSVPEEGMGRGNVAARCRCGDGLRMGL
eukprot:gene2722-biopygen7374